MSPSNLNGSSHGQRHNPTTLVTPDWECPHEASSGNLQNQTVGVHSRNQPTAIHDPDDQLVLSLAPTPSQNIPVVENENQGHNHATSIPAQDLQDKEPFDLDQELDAVIQIVNSDMLFNSLVNETTDYKSALMSQIANNAVEELKKLLSTNEPFWLRDVNAGKFVFQRDSYESILGRRYCLTGPDVQIECSRDSRLVNMNVEQLVDMFLDSGKWSDLFPTIVKKAQTLQVLESGLSRNRNGALLLMNAEMQILSHLVPTPEFHFLRCCKQIESGAWVIGDVSVNSSKCKTTTGSRVWRRPSGCLIREMNEGMCWVSWVEHVEVDEKIENDQVLGDATFRTNAYGAERWLLTLERMCQNFTYTEAGDEPK